MQSSGATLAVLFEAQVDGGERTADISDAVDGEPTLQGIATASVARPIETAQNWIVERIALQAGVVTWLELSERVHGLEITGPLLGTTDPDCKVTRVGCDRKGR